MSSDTPGTDEDVPETAPGAVTDAASDDSAQFGHVGFTLRELLIVGVWFVAFVVSFFPLFTGQSSLWGLGLRWILPIGVPTIAVFLLVLRRLSPQGIRRVGSLGIDQFASVAFTVAFAFWLPTMWDATAVMLAAGVGTGWVLWVEAVLMLALVVLTVFAPLIPGLREDFEGRPEHPAHRAAAPIRPVVARPRSERVAAPVPSVSQAPVASDAAPAAQPFWVLAPTERDVVGETGEPVFRVGPDAWALVIAEDADSFLVRHEDGRTGRLFDTSDVTRG